MLLDRTPTIRLLLPVWSIVCGAVVIGVISPMLGANSAWFQEFGMTFAKAGGNSAYTTAQVALVAGAAGGGMMIAVAPLGALGHFMKNRVIFYAYIVLAVIAGIVCAVGGGLYLPIFDIIGPKIYYEPTNENNPQLVGVQADMLNYEIAIFNECCARKNSSDQSVVGECTGNNAADCPNITNPLVATVIPDGAVEKLCSCALPNAAKLSAFETAIRASKVCELGNTAILQNADTLVLPPTKIPGNWKLLTVTHLQFDTVKFTQVPVIGWYQTPDTDPNRKAGELPFGCGLGYVKGVSWYLDVWHQQQTGQLAYVCIALGCCQIFGIAMAVLIGYVQAMEDRELASGRVDKWDQVKDLPASFIMSPQQQQQMMVSAYAQNEASLAAVTPGISVAEIQTKLREFYAKFDPAKDLADVEDVANWAAVNGIEALNAKLRGKYGKDLDSVAGGHTTGSRLLSDNPDL